VPVNDVGGPDVFTLEASGRIQGLTSDGVVTWVSNVASATRVLPDTSGGLLAVSEDGVTCLDQTTGNVNWTHSDLDAAQLALRGDGLVLAIQSDEPTPFPARSLVALDPDTGSQVFSVPLENTTRTISGGCPEESSYNEEPTTTSRIVVDGSGTTYLAYIVDQTTAEGDCDEGTTVDVRSLKLLSISEEGTATVRTLHSWTGEESYEQTGTALEITTLSVTPDVGLGVLIVSDQEQVTLAWSMIMQAYCAFSGLFGCEELVEQGPQEQTLTTTSAATTISEVAVQGDFDIVDPMIAGQDATLFASVRLRPQHSPALAAISPSGQTVWILPAEYVPIVATLDGGVAAQIPGEAAVAMIDASGSATLHPLGESALYSWLGDWYSSTQSAVASIAAPSVEVADSAWAARGGNPSGTQTGTEVLTRVTRNHIGALADAYAVGGSENWAWDLYDGASTCNIFVHDVIVEADATAPHQFWLSPSRMLKMGLGLANSAFWPALAGEWATPGKKLKCWDIVPEGADGAESGDVIAHKFDPVEGATGHVGIVVSPYPSPRTASADAGLIPQGKISKTDWGFREPPLHIGLKSASVVRQYVCY
jgi:hypothetical protein